MTERLSPGPFALIIMDGYAHNPNPRANAVFHAKKPNIDRLMKRFPHTELVTYGERVGLPDDQMGNSEVGHLNIGAGRVVEQELTRINRAVRKQTMHENPELQHIVSRLKTTGGALHVIGLASCGGVHSTLEHMQALITAAVKLGVGRIFIHAITDGRDRPPNAAVEELAKLLNFLNEVPQAHLSTVIGRYFAMDRDKRWDRTKKAYELFTKGIGEHCVDPLAALRDRYAMGQSDEFIEPVVIVTESANRSQFVEDGDALLFTNFRADRMRQIVRAFLGSKVEFNGFDRDGDVKLSDVLLMTEYEEGLPARVLFAPFVVNKHLGNVVADAGLSQLRIAETEKYAHVTYFFSGGNEEQLQGEERILIQSPTDVPTYDKKPEMSANGVTQALVERLKSGEIDVAIVNFANCDMVGHTGDFAAAVSAVETVDRCVGTVIETILELDGTAIVTADHGNADQMVDYDTGEPHTFHTKYPVPLILVSKHGAEIRLRSGGSLCDIAPTICQILGVAPPSEMTGRTLIESR